MNKRPKTNKKRHVVNFFGVCGYIFISLSWLWSIILNMNFIQSIAVSVSPTVDTPVIEPIVGSTAGDPAAQVVFLFLSIVITIIILAVCVFMIFKAPAAVIKTEAAIVHETAKHVTPVVLRVQGLTPEKQTPAKFRIMSSRLAVVVKALLVIVPLVLAWLSQFSAERVFSFTASIIGSLLLVGVSALFFVLQYVFAYALSVKRHDIM